jgi:AbrB family looped-hinge helix DNA binding protein
MSVSTVTSKGQTTIPKDVRDAAGLRPGVTVHYTVLADGTVILRARNRGVRDLGVKPKSGRSFSADQLNR